MKCPWRKFIYVYKSGVNMRKYTTWEDCYKNECPFYDCFKMECRRAEHDSAKSI